MTGRRSDAFGAPMQGKTEGMGQEKDVYKRQVWMGVEENDIETLKGLPEF